MGTAHTWPQGLQVCPWALPPCCPQGLLSAPPPGPSGQRSSHCHWSLLSLPLPLLLHLQDILMSPLPISCSSTIFSTQSPWSLLLKQLLFVECFLDTRLLADAIFNLSSPRRWVLSPKGQVACPRCSGKGSLAILCDSRALSPLHPPPLAGCSHPPGGEGPGTQNHSGIPLLGPPQRRRRV